MAAGVNIHLFARAPMPKQTRLAIASSSRLVLVHGFERAASESDPQSCVGRDGARLQRLHENVYKCNKRRRKKKKKSVVTPELRSRELWGHVGSRGVKASLILGGQDVSSSAAFGSLNLP